MNMMITNNNNNVSFGVKYDLSDKANMFSHSQKRALKKLVNKLGKYDIVCIGTKKVKSLNVDGEPFYNSGARIDYILNNGKERHSIRIADRFPEFDYLNNLYADNPKGKQKKFNEICFDWAKDVLREAEYYKSPKYAKKPENFSEDLYEYKTDVRQWARKKKSYYSNSIFDKIRNFIYEVKDFSFRNF